MSEQTVSGQGQAGGGEATSRLRHAATFFMFSSFLNMLLCLSFIFLAPAEAVFPLCAAAYAVVASLEWGAGIRSPVTLSLLGLYLALAGLAAALPEVRLYTHYAGALIFGWLALLLAGLLLAGRPFTTFYARGQGMPALHRAVSLVWIAAHLSALAASLYFMPDVLFIYVPCALCVAGGLVTIGMSLVWFGPAHARRRRFTVGAIQVRELQHGTEPFDHFCRFFTRHSVADHGAGKGQDEGELEHWYGIMQQAEAGLRGRSVALGAYDGERLVGTVRCVLDRRGPGGALPLPMEEQLDTSFDGLRRLGRLLYVGRVAVDHEYRQRPEVMSALFKGIVEVALERDVCFIAVTSFTNRVATFMKLGFETLFPRSDPRHVYREPFGISVVPLVMNLAHLIMSADYKKHSHEHFAELLNPYLQERWYKRAVLRHLWRPVAHRPWECDLAAVRAAAVSAGALSGRGTAPAIRPEPA